MAISVADVLRLFSLENNPYQNLVFFVSHVFGEYIKSPNKNTSEYKDTIYQKSLNLLNEILVLPAANSLNLSLEDSEFQARYKKALVQMLEYYKAEEEYELCALIYKCLKSVDK